MFHLGGFFQHSGHSWCPAAVQDLGFGFLSGTGLCPSPLLGFPANLMVSGGVFFGGLFFHGFLPPLPGCAGNCGAGVYPAAESAALWRCAALSPWPEGQGGTRRWHRLPPPPPAWERSHLLVSAQAPGKACRRVCPLARGRASKPPLFQGWSCSLLKSPRCFLPGDLCCSFLCSSPSSSPVALASPLPSHPAFPSASRMAPSPQCSFFLCPQLLSLFPQCHRVRASSAGLGAFRGYVAVNFMASLNGAGAASVLGGVTSHGEASEKWEAMK